MYMGLFIFLSCGTARQRFAGQQRQQKSLSSDPGSLVGVCAGVSEATSPVKIHFHKYRHSAMTLYHRVPLCMHGCINI